MLEDGLLIWKLKGGSKDALRAIYEKYADDLVTLAANLLNDKIGAEDVVQDVFISFAESVDKFRLTGSLKGYLAKCVANRSRDCIRKNRRGQIATAGKAERKSADVKSPVQLVINSEELKKLRHALAELPYEQWEAVVLRAKGGMRFREIARLQGVPAKTVQSRYRYGLDKLQSLLDQESKQ